MAIEAAGLTAEEVVKEVFDERKKKFCKEQLGINVDVKAYRILVRAPIYEEKTQGGIIRLDSYTDEIRKTANIGLVLAVGPEAFTKSAASFKAEVGDWVIYSKYEREPFVAVNKNLLCYFLNDDRILAALSKEDAEILLEGGK